jgi:hypothetical protein
MAKERILNKTLFKKSPTFSATFSLQLQHTPSTGAINVPTPERRPEIPAVADDKLGAASTPSSPPQEIFYETTPTRGAVRDIDKEEAANYTARRFGTTASLYLVNIFTMMTGNI